MLDALGLEALDEDVGRFPLGHRQSTIPTTGNFNGVALVARYAKSGDLNIAYVAEGDRPLDLVWIPPWISQVEYLWSEESLELVMERVKQFARLITFDRRGSGLSDPLAGAPTLEEQMDDVIAVMDAAGSERAAILGTLEGGSMAALFAATHPDRVSALVLYAAFARATWRARLRVDLDRRGARSAHGGAGRPLGRGLGAGRRRAEPHGRPRVHGVGGPARAARGEPGGRSSASST